MRLLLDEMYSPRLAAELRARGHDVIAVKERADLLEHDDERILIAAAMERRVLLTENVRHLMPIVERFRVEARSHHGVLLASARSLRRSSRGLGLLVRTIDRYLARHPQEDALADSWDWLSAVE